MKKNARQDKEGALRYNVDGQIATRQNVDF
jgi:hypothetical protein